MQKLLQQKAKFQARVYHQPRIVPRAMFLRNLQLPLLPPKITQRPTRIIQTTPAQRDHYQPQEDLDRQKEGALVDSNKISTNLPRATRYQEVPSRVPLRIREMTPHMAPSPIVRLGKVARSLPTHTVAMIQRDPTLRMPDQHPSRRIGIQEARITQHHLPLTLHPQRLRVTPPKTEVAIHPQRLRVKYGLTYLQRLRKKVGLIHLQRPRKKAGLIHLQRPRKGAGEKHQLLRVKDGELHLQELRVRDGGLHLQLKVMNGGLHLQQLRAKYGFFHLEEQARKTGTLDHRNRIPIVGAKEGQTIHNLHRTLTGEVAHDMATATVRPLGSTGAMDRRATLNAVEVDLWASRDLAATSKVFREEERGIKITMASLRGTHGSRMLEILGQRTPREDLVRTQDYQQRTHQQAMQTQLKLVREPKPQLARTQLRRRKDRQNLIHRMKDRTERLH